MHYDVNDTIAAIASPLGGGGARGIVRLCGPATIRVVASLLADLDSLTSPLTDRACISERILLGEDVIVPCDLFVWPDERSYTRQPAAEIHTVGSPPVLDLILDEACRRGCRLAGPGEFTMRAFLAGRLDLAQAEAVLGIIEAEDSGSLNSALAQLAGGLSGPLESLRGTLLDVLADLEAGLDFADEDIRFIAKDELNARLSECLTQLTNVDQMLAQRSTSNELPKVVLCGMPNVGKSSLFNALHGKQAALVAPAAGTTRDYLSTTLALKDGLCRLVDTAGLDFAGASRSPASEAQSHTKDQIESAKLLVFCLDSTRSISREEYEWIGQIRRHPTLLAVTKTDRPASFSPPETAILTSSITGAGLTELLGRINDVLLNVEPADGGYVPATVVRCADSLRRAKELLAGAIGLVETDAGDELVAAELRTTLDALGEVVGAVYTDDVLDRVFSRFCIGK